MIKIGDKITFSGCTTSGSCERCAETSPGSCIPKEHIINGFVIGVVTSVDGGSFTVDAGGKSGYTISKKAAKPYKASLERMCSV